MNDITSTPTTPVPIPPHVLTDDERAAAGAFWASIDDLNVANELADFHFIMGEVSEVYMHITGGRMSKPNYHAGAVIGVHENHIEEQIEAAIEEGIKDRELERDNENAEIAQAAKDFHSGKITLFEFGEQLDELAPHSSTPPARGA